MISVGAYDNVNNSNWSDDTMAGFSCYVNPSGDREKPEVVAPGVEIVGIGMDGNLVLVPELNSGTSFAAPQVAGLAALLIERQTDLRTWPEASRAIIMASAVHNIEGPSGIPTGEELKDGAGGIDAALADLTAKTRWTSATSPCTGPCWWGIDIDNTIFPVGTSVYRYFNASRGERIRAAISWWSNADCPDEANCSHDLLDTDLNFGVKDPDGEWVLGAWSASWDNNYELVDFTAPKTGKYKIDVYKARADEGEDEDPNYLGLAFVKNATYLPDVRGNYQGWNSVFRVRNDGAESRQVTVTFFYTNGQVKASASTMVNPNQLWTFNVGSLIGSNFIGSAIVDGAEDLTVLVMNIHESTPYAAGSYVGLSEASTTLYLPILQRANNSMYSDFTLFNVGTGPAQVQVQYIAEKSPYWGCWATGISIPANGSHNVNLRIDPECAAGESMSSPFVGGAKVTSDQPLVAVVNQWRDLNADGSIEGFMSYEALPAGSSASFMPILQRNNNNWYTSSSIQDTSGNSEGLTLYYYRENDGVGCEEGPLQQTLDSNDILIVFPSPPGGVCAQPPKFVGAAYATRSKDFAVVVNQTESTTWNQQMSYSAIGGGTRMAIVPWVMKDHDGWQGRNDWYTGLNVQNLGTDLATVTVTYYNNDGSGGRAPDVAQVPPRTNHVFLPVPGSGGAFKGSAVVTADQPIAVVANHWVVYSTDDTFMSHTGVNH